MLSLSFIFSLQIICFFLISDVLVFLFRQQIVVQNDRAAGFSDLPEIDFCLRNDLVRIVKLDIVSMTRAFNLFIHVNENKLIYVQKLIITAIGRKLIFCI